MPAGNYNCKHVVAKVTLVPCPVNLTGKRDKGGHGAATIKNTRIILLLFIIIDTLLVSIDKQSLLAIATTKKKKKKKKKKTACKPGQIIANFFQQNPKKQQTKITNQNIHKGQLRPTKRARSSFFKKMNVKYYSKNHIDPERSK